jgi:hypothetical protein
LICTRFYQNVNDTSTIEALLASANVYPKLLSTNFAYPFKENAAAFQYAYEKKNEIYAHQHQYSTMHAEGRLKSFNSFMEGKFGFESNVPDRIRAHGYDLDRLLLNKGPQVKVVDIGGGQGQMLLQMKKAYPCLTAENLILQEFNGDVNPPAGITAMDWDFKSSNPQPITGATIYSLVQVLHNIPDVESIQGLRKIAAAMGPHSRLLIQELPKSEHWACMHAAMIAMHGGRERTNDEWHAIAELAGLKVTFETPFRGDDLDIGLIEMMKI